MKSKEKLKEINEKFRMLAQEKAQLEQRISDIVAEIYRLQGEARLLKEQGEEDKEKDKK